jgi:hypothetical protein
MTRRRRKKATYSKENASRYGQKRGVKRPSFEMLGPDDKEFQDIFSEVSV